MSVPRPALRTPPGPRSLPAGGALPAGAGDQRPWPAPPASRANRRPHRLRGQQGGRGQDESVMMTRRAWSFGDDRQVSATAMITTRAVPALLPAHHRRVARTHLTPKDFADPLGCAVGRAQAVCIVLDEVTRRRLEKT